MPTVPLYDQQVQDANMPAVRDTVQAPLEAFGGGAVSKGPSEGIQGLATDTFKFAEKQKEDAEKYAILDAHARFIEQKHKLLYDKDTGALNKKGKDSFAIFDEYMPKVDELAASIGGGLSAGARSKFNQLMLKEKSEIDGVFNKHVFAESAKFQEETRETNKKLYQQEAVFNLGDFGKIEEAKQNQYRLVDMATGKSPEVKSFEKLQAASETNVAVIKQFLAGNNDVGAKAYFESLKGNQDKEFTKEGLAWATAQITAATEDNEAYRQAQKAWRDSGGNYRNAAQLVEMDVKDLDVQKKTLAELDRMHSRSKAIDNDQQIKVEFDSINYIDKNKALPPWFRTLDLDHRNRVQRYLDDKLSGKEPATDWAIYTALRAKASSDDPAMVQEFRETNVYKYINVLGKSEYKQIVDVWVKSREGKGEDDDTLKGWKTQKEIIDNAFGAAGLNTKPKSEKEKQILEDAERRLEKLYFDFQKEKGRKPNNQEVRDLTSAYTAEVIDKKNTFWFDSKKKAYEYGDEGMPLSQRLRIVQMLKTTGRPVTQDNIMKIYNFEQGKKK